MQSAVRMEEKQRFSTDDSSESGIELNISSPKSVLYCAHFWNTKVNTNSTPLKYHTTGKTCFQSIASGSFLTKNFRNSQSTNKNLKQCKGKTQVSNEVFQFLKFCHKIFIFLRCVFLKRKNEEKKIWQHQDLLYWNQREQELSSLALQEVVLTGQFIYMTRINSPLL